MKIKCLVVDEDPFATQCIKDYLNFFKQFEVVCGCQNAIDAWQVLQKINIDLMFLDTQLPEINGIDLLKSLTNKPQVIIITSNKEFAIDGFDLDVLDYILKPVSLNRFFKAINKFLEINSNKNLNVFNTNLYQNNFLNEILVKDNNKTYRIKPNEILYIEGMREYIKIITKTENIVTKSSLTKFFNQLPEELFLRTHKSFIVNKKMVHAFTSSSVEILNKKIPIGRSYRLNSMELLKSG